MSDNRPEIEWRDPQIDDSYTGQIATLRARVAELEAAARWIPVGERLPEISSHYLCAYRSYEGNLLVRIEYFTPIYMGKFPIDITHWRELPAPPEEREEL